MCRDTELWASFIIASGKKNCMCKYITSYLRVRRLNLRDPFSLTSFSFLSRVKSCFPFCSVYEDVLCWDMIPSLGGNR